MNMMMALHMGGSALAAGQGGNPSDSTATFGALTLSGAGGVDLPSGATSITNAGGTNLTVSGGKVVPASNGVSAGTATFNNGATMAVTATADEYSALTAAEVSAAATAAGANKTVRIRAAAQAIQIALSSLTKTGLTITGADGHSVDEIECTSVTGVTFSGLNIENDNSADDPWNNSNNAALRVYSSTVDFVGCNIDCGPWETKGITEVRTVAELGQRFGGFDIDTATVVIDQCDIRRIRDGVTANFSVMTIKRTHFQEIAEDAITGLNTDWTVDDNTATIFEGRSGKRFQANGAITGTISPGDTLTNGLTGSSERIIGVISVGADYVDGVYNNWSKPNDGEVMTGPTGSFTILSQNTSYDGIHGDFFQPITNNSATKDYQVHARRNMIYRSQAQIFGQEQREQNTQGFLVQQVIGYTQPWGYNVDISYNIVQVGQPFGFSISLAKSGQVIGNSTLYAEHGPASDLLCVDCTNTRIEYNVGDRNLPGVVIQVAGTTPVGAPRNNVFVEGFGTAQAAAYADVTTYPRTKAGFAPRVGSVIDLGGAGALDTDGNWRTITLAAAVLSTPVGTQSGETTANTSVVTDLGLGTLYAAVYPTAATPSVADIKAGTGAAWSGTSTSLTLGQNNFSATGLTADTAYKAHFIQTDAVGDSNTVTSSTFTTAAGAATYPNILDGSPTEVLAAVDQSSVTASGYTAPAGSNRKLIVVIHEVHEGGRELGDRTCAWGGESMTQLLVQGENNTAYGYEITWIYEIKEADFPSGATGDIVSTMVSGTASRQTISAFTIENANQVTAPVVESVGGFSYTDDITPSAADSLIIGVATSANNTADADWSAGLTLVGRQLTGTSTVLIGDKTQQAASSLTCTADYASGRGIIELVSFAPAP